MEIKNECLFTAVVMFHNHEEYAEKTLSSILEQKHKFSWEVLVCDDASVDGTKAIIEKYAERYPDIVKTIYRTENWGLVKNRFDLISKARGKYYSQCDGDDFWFPGKIQMQIEYMESNPDIDYCCTDSYCYYKNGKYFYKQPNSTTVDINTPFPFAPGAYCEMCAKTSVVKRYIDEIQPEKRIWAYDDVPLLIWMKRNAKWGKIENNYVAIRLVEGSVSNPRKKDVKWTIWYYTWVIDMWHFFSTGDEREKQFIEKWETYYDMFCALEARNRKEYRIALWKLGGAKLKRYISYMPFGMELLLLLYNIKLNYTR